jgi:hypothetical protein
MALNNAGPAGGKREQRAPATLRLCEKSVAALLARQAVAVVPKRTDAKKADLDALRNLLHMLQKRENSQS